MEIKLPVIILCMFTGMDVLHAQTTPLPLTATSSQTNVSCYGSNDGSANVNPSGGAAPYSFLWAPSGGSAATASGLPAGDYTCTITDSISVSVVKTFTISQPDRLDHNTITGAQTVCSGSVPAALSGSTPEGATGIYTYLWLGSTTDAISGFTAAPGTNNAKDYLPPALTQTTWFKRIVFSGTCDADTTDALNITVNTSVVMLSQPKNAYAWLDSGGFTVNAAGGSLAYQWQAKYNGNVWHDMYAAGNTDTIADTISVKTGGIPLSDNNYSYYVSYYRCKIFNSCNTVYSDSATLTIYTYEWTGKASSNWNDSGNWSCGWPPWSWWGGLNVAIPATALNNPVVSGNHAINFLTIETGKTFSMSSNDDVITIGGDIRGTGLYNGSKGTTVFNAPSPQFIPGGTYYNLSVSCNAFGLLSGNIIIKNNIVSSVLLRLSGELLIDSHATYALSWVSTEQRNSKLTIRNIGTGGRTGAVLFPVMSFSWGYGPVTITNTGIADAFSVGLIDSVTSQYSGKTPVGARINNNAVNRTWLVEEGVPGGSNVTMTVQWTASNELPGFNRGSSYLSYYNGSEWIRDIATPATGSGPYMQTRSGLNSFSAFGVGSSGTLPVELTAFDAMPAGDDAVLTWATASETNNDRFEVLRSTDGSSFETIGTVKGNGTTNRASSYHFTDRNASDAGTIVFYALKQVDINNEAAISSIVKVDFVNTANNRVTIMPNPFNSELNIVFANEAAADAVIIITDINGKKAMEINELLIKGAQKICLPNIHSLPEGIYFITVQTGKEMIRSKVIRVN